MELWLLIPHTKKWDSETRRQRNKPVRPFRQKSSRKSTRPSSVTDTGDVWEEFNLGEPDINDEGVWVRIGQWVYKECSAATFEFNPDPRPDERYNIRAHLRKTLTEWTGSNKMRSTGEERDVRRDFLELSQRSLLLRLCWVSRVAQLYQGPHFLVLPVLHHISKVWELSTSGIQRILLLYWVVCGWLTGLGRKMRECSLAASRPYIEFSLIATGLPDKTLSRPTLRMNTEASASIQEVNGPG
ncbi:hypothetical protein F5880DRAFT_590156 [Lentinula raphanica]|nr:hypothetical protein F5880DRAFT_590156 [Lentinula raphanica]